MSSLPHDSQEADAAADAPQAMPSGVAHSEVSLPKIVRFGDLARCGDEVWIEHENQLYRLRRTRQGKLILTK